MFTDMVGYTALGQRNESLSLALVREQRKLIRPILSRHNGREVKTIGDAFLVEFPNALDAVRCSYDIQRATREFNFSLPEERRIHLRIGVHLGDVEKSGGDISGDAVNVASRIDALAEDGGVCLTRQVYDNVQSKFDLPMKSLGIKPLKNVSTPMEVYRMVMPWEEGRVTIPTQLERNRIAVLPLTNMSPDTADEYFSDGMTEELISTLSKISGLKVIARTSVMGYKGEPNKKIDEIAKELGVGTILEGSVRKGGDRIRITVQLVSSLTSEPLWTESFDRDLSDVLNVQNEVARSVAEQIRIKLTPQELTRMQVSRSVNPEAHDAYLRGSYYRNMGETEHLHKARDYFLQSLEKDPLYAQAYAALADYYSVLPFYTSSRPEEVFPKAKAAVTKALGLDDSCAEAHAALAYIRTYYDWNFADADLEFQRALALKPNDATIHHRYSRYLVSLGRIDGALEEINLAQELDPLSLLAKANAGMIYYFGRDYDSAILRLQEVLGEDQNFPTGHWGLGLVYEQKNNLPEAVAEFEKAAALSGGGGVNTIGSLGHAYALAGHEEKAQTLLGELELRAKKENVSAYQFALIFLGLGNKSRALAALEEAFRDRSTLLIYLKMDPRFDALRSDANFLNILRNIGLEL